MIRNDIGGSSDLAEIWAVELDIFEKFKAICKKHNLTYYANGGTLLGAVRHGGFIPWDDDMDLVMFWRDYQVLLEVAPSELDDPYFFQSYLTEPNGEVSHSRIRRSDTTGYTKWEHENIADPDYNKGLFIDIFPMFNVPPCQKERDRQREVILKYWRAIRGYTALELRASGSSAESVYAQYIPDYMDLSQTYSIQEIKEKYIGSCAFIEDDTEEIGLTSWKTFLPNLIWKRSWFDNAKEAPFEHTTINCPGMSEKILDVSYGDWRTPKKGAFHEMYFVDPHKSYREYCGKSK